MEVEVELKEVGPGHTLKPPVVCLSILSVVVVL